MTRGKAASMLISLYAAAFLFQLSGNSYGTFLPLFAKTLGASYTELGIIGFGSSTTGVIISFSFGRISKRFRAKNLLLASLVMSVCSIALLSVVKNVLEVVLLQLLSGIANGLFFPIADALASEIAVPESREHVLGRYSAAWGGSLLVGPLLGAAAMTALGFRVGVLVSAAIGVASLGVVVLGVLPSYATRPLRRQDGSSDTSGLGPSIHSLIAITIVNQFAYGILFSLFPVYASSFSLNLFQIGALFSTYALVRFLFFLLSHRVAALGVLNTLGISLATLVLPFVLLGALHDFSAFLLAFSLIGVSSGVFFPMIMNLFAWARKGRGMDAQMGVYESMNGTGSLVGSALGGVVADAVSPSAPYYLSGGVLLLLVPLILRTGRETAARVSTTG